MASRVSAKLLAVLLISACSPGKPNFPPPDGKILVVGDCEYCDEAIRMANKTLERNKIPLVIGDEGDAWTLEFTEEALVTADGRIACGLAQWHGNAIIDTTCYASAAALHGSIIHEIGHLHHLGHVESCHNFMSIQFCGERQEFESWQLDIIRGHYE